MAKLIQSRIPLTKTHTRFTVWDEGTDTITVFNDKFPAIVYMHEKFGAELKSQWAFPTLFADKMVWLPDADTKSHWDDNTQTFTFCNPDTTSSDNHAIWHYIKEATITRDVPNEADILAAADKLNLRGLARLDNDRRRQVEIIATWLSKSNPNNYTAYLSLYPVNELANYISVYSGLYLETPVSIDQDLILAVASSMGLEPTFNCTNNPRKHIIMWTRQFGALYLPQKLPATIYSYAHMDKYLFSERYVERQTKKAKTERARYDLSKHADKILADLIS
ncbi:MAG: hypothetical protein L3J67_07440 [Hyphomicrobiaceae bacterium]|nr:hypothetical protein [Hyphomicrobiaceae bacterium]